ncbi:MAG: hypothetical protein QOD76_1136 [Solirubrobacteraceae bacterium]|nr:hypothetical protein [Solirubrobacteraceae bacterium]
MPTFCRHNRFIQNCPICREPEAPEGPAAPRRRAPAGKRSARAAVRITQAARQADDGYRSALVPGLKLASDAERLAAELAFASARVAALAAAPPGLYAEIASEPDVEEATWLAFQVAYLGPSEDVDPFAGIRAARSSWASGEPPALDATTPGPRSPYDSAAGTATLTAYRAWAGRAGSQAAAFGGDPSWSPERRFDRIFERLALPGLPRGTRFELLLTLGALGRYELRPGSLQLGGAEDEVATAAKRVFGIGDALLLERRAVQLAAESEVPIGALDLALFNWARAADARATAGFGDAVRDDSARQRSRAALGL